jgi:hypothetical protein
VKTLERNFDRFWENQSKYIYNNGPDLGSRLELENQNPNHYEFIPDKQIVQQFIKDKRSTYPYVSVFSEMGRVYVVPYRKRMIIETS